MKYSMKKILVLFLMLFLIPLASCGNTKAEVVATNFIGYDAARAVIGSEDIKLDMLLKPGLDIHSYEPSATDIREVLNAKVFIYIGGESDEWVETEILPKLSSNVKVVSMFEVLQHGLLFEEGEEDEYDEHVWTNPDNYRAIVLAVGEALMETYKDKASNLEKNTDAYATKLFELDKAFQTKIARNNITDIVVADRFPFLYFVKRYGLEHLGALSGCSQDTNVASAKILELKNRVEEKKLTKIYIIELSEGRIANSVKSEIDNDIKAGRYNGSSPTIVTFHSIQNITKQEFDNKLDYVYFMNLNLEAL